MGVTQAYVDDQARVAFQPQLEGRSFSGYYLWSNGRIEMLAADGRNQIGSIAVGNLGLRGARGSRFYSSGSQPGGGDQAIFDHSGSGWQIAVSNYDRMPDGSGGFGLGTWDANARGDIVFVSQAGSPLALTIRTAGGELRQVQSLLVPTAEGDQITRIQDIDLRSDGRIFFSAFDTTGRYSIYAAEPLQ
jgi:hypothetical protein